MPRLLLVPVLVLLLATPAQARIDVGKGIGAVRIGASEKAVRKALGTPDARFVRKDEIQGTVLRLRFGLLRATLGPGSAASARVQFVSTTASKERTSRGIGVGSTVSAVRQKVSGVRCRNIPQRRKLCSVGNERPGTIVTDFRISSSGKVTEVSVGRVID